MKSLRGWTVATRASQVAFYCCGAILFVAGTYYILSPLKSATTETRTTMHDSGDVVREVKPQIAPAGQTVGLILRNAAVITDETAKASTAQKEYWKTLSTQTSDLIGDTQGTVKSWGGLAEDTRAQISPIGTRFQTTLDRTNTLLSSTNDQVIKVGPFLMSGTSLFGHIDGLAADPALHGSLVNLNAFMGHAELFMGDVQHVTHKFAYPPKQNVGQRVLELFPLAERLAEFGYYTGAWK